MQHLGLKYPHIDRTVAIRGHISVDKDLLNKKKTLKSYF
jgi:hypothetical protein